MKILLFGATGPTGKIILDNLLTDNHQVTCYVRNPDKISTKHKSLTVTSGSINDQVKIEQSLKDKDLVISALGKKPTLTDNSMSLACDTIVRSMEKTTKGHM